MQLIFFLSNIRLFSFKCTKSSQKNWWSKLLVYLCWLSLFMPCNFLKLLLVYFLALFSPCCLVSRIKEPFDPCWLFRMTEAVVIQSKKIQEVYPKYDMLKYGQKNCLLIRNLKFCSFMIKVLLKLQALPNQIL